MDATMILEKCKENDRAFVNDVLMDTYNTPVNKRQGQNFLQQFFNYTGLSYKEPVVLTEEDFSRKWEGCKRPEILYHMDFCSEKNGIRQFRVLKPTTLEQAYSHSLQHMGLEKDENGKPFGQYYAFDFGRNSCGDGLYLGKYEFYEWIQKIHRLTISGTAFKCFINPDAKIATREKVEEEAKALREEDPTFDYFYEEFLKNLFHDEYKICSVLAAVFGYDVVETIEDSQPHGLWCDFTTTAYRVINRSVLTICDEITSYRSGELISGNWKEPGEILFRGGGVKANAKTRGVYRDRIAFDGNGHYAIKRWGEENYGEWQEFPLRCKDHKFF